jgi:AraC family transcriptional regulator, regulatory protein of adaptative response / methylated-DNA-[protein]-cysteine methyltransferase
MNSSAVDLSHIITQAALQADASRPVEDYEIVRRILAFISTRWRDQPSIEAIADHVGLTTTEVHRLFRRWAGLSPKAFLQAVTLDEAKRVLDASASVMDCAYEVGLSGPGRLHDLFVTHEAVTPGDYKRGGLGLVMTYGFHSSPFGEAVLVTTLYGLAGLGFVDNGDREAALADMILRWPLATYIENAGETAPYAARVFDAHLWQPETPLRVVLIGTDWQVRVWETLLHIPMGGATTYSAIAERVCTRKAARAVGAAVGRNPISFVVPCHRVLGKSGALTGYHWGLTRKQAILGWERGKVSPG